MVNSPLIWAGGKSRAMSHVLDALPHGDCLVEPFVGSGSVFLNTDYKTYILCDSNAALINFYSILKSNTEGLLNAAAELPAGDPGRAIVAAHKSQVEQLLAGHFESLTTKKQATLLAGQISFLLEGAISRAGLEGNSVLLLRARTMINDMLKAL